MPILSIALLALQSAPATADWKSDEAYIKRLRARVKQLSKVFALFERHRRALELVEAEIANVQLGLADPLGKPDVLVKKLLKDAYPGVRITMTPRHTKAPHGIGIWVWRCRIEGAMGELRWATQLLRQKGLFIVPNRSDPVQLLPERDQRRGALVFHGHHIRLKDLPVRMGKHEQIDDALLAKRTDPLAAEIRRLQAEVAQLRTRVAAVGFEARLESIRMYIELLKGLTRRSIDPFRAITPLLDLELVRFDLIQHEGKRLVIRGATPSKSTRRAARRWLRRHFRRARLRYRIEALDLLYGNAAAVELLVPDDMGGKGPPCRLLTAGAGAVEVGLAASRRAMVVIHRGGKGVRRVSGRVKRQPCERALGAAAAALGLALLREGRDVLLVPQDAATPARAALRRKPPPAGHRLLRLAMVNVPLGRALSRIACQLRGALEAPREAINGKTRVTLLGRAPVATWVRLLGAGSKLWLSAHRGRLVLSRKAGGARGRRVPALPPGQVRSTFPRKAHTLGLALLRPSLFMLQRGRKTFVVLSAPDGSVSIVRRGTLVGRNRSQVARVDRRGVRLLWSGGGVTARLRLPPGEPRR